MNSECDICIIGSGAGGGPVAQILSQAGHSVVVLEKGPWFKNGDFYKDEMAAGRHATYTPSLSDEPHVLVEKNHQDKWEGQRTEHTSMNFWNGNCVGGATNFMSGYFYRLKPVDFNLLSTFGPIKGADIVDWPISYKDLEPYYKKVETEVGISGTGKSFPFPPTIEHPLATKIDRACTKLGFKALTTPRAILSEASGDRGGCTYSGYCGSYGCSTGAKGSSRVALLNKALATGRCEIRPHSMVTKLESNSQGKVVSAHYVDGDGERHELKAKIFVVACHAIETARLLLLSTGPKYPQGLANGSGLVGKNLLFSAGGAGQGKFVYAKMKKKEAEEIKSIGPFVNRSLQDWYTIKDKKMGPPLKGGTLSFSLSSQSAMGRAQNLMWDNGSLIWGERLKQKLHSHFHQGQTLKMEIFCDWLPVHDCFVQLDPQVKDKWGLPVARVQTGFHMHNLTVGWYLGKKGEKLLKTMGAEDVYSYSSGRPPTNLVAGTCRFGADPKKSVLDPDCRSHEAENLFVTDGSFQPTGGSVPYTWTIYANAFRVADKIKSQL